MTTNENQLMQQFGLTKAENYNFSESANAFIGPGYTSVAGNIYFDSIRLVEGIFIKEDVGQGYKYEFINRIQLFEIKKRSLICERKYQSKIYSKNFIIGEVVDMLLNVLAGPITNIDSKQKRASLIGQIDAIVSNAFQNDQRIVLQNQMGRLLTA
jgi:hypothetical protein